MQMRRAAGHAVGSAAEILSLAAAVVQAFVHACYAVLCCGVSLVCSSNLCGVIGAPAPLEDLQGHDDKGAAAQGSGLARHSR